MKIVGNLLFDDKGKQVPFKRSPNIGGQFKPEYIIIHYTASSSADGAIEWMVSPQSKVSAHLHEDRLGNFVQLVPFTTVAWHAGQSEWKGIVGLNSHSIGIELQNTGTQPYPQVQLDALVLACKAICQAYHIKEILGHSDIAPGRKKDPGPQFPMEWLREEVLKVDPAVNLVTTKKTTSDLNLRQTAGATGKLISTLPKGTEVNVLDEVNGWSSVFVCKSKLLGWVSSKYLS